MTEWPSTLMEFMAGGTREQQTRRRLEKKCYEYVLRIISVEAERSNARRGGEGGGKEKMCNSTVDMGCCVTRTPASA